MEPWALTEESEPVPAGTVTLVQGSSFAICDARGDVAGGVQGIFVGDTRICSRLVLTVADRRLEPLATATYAPFAATFAGRTADRSLLVQRDLWIGRGARLDVRVRNLTATHRAVAVRLEVDTDLAHLFSVKEGRPEAAATTCSASADGLRIADAANARGLVVSSEGGFCSDDGVVAWHAELDPGAEWSTCVELLAVRGGEVVASRYPCGEAPASAVPTERQAAWARRLPTLDTDVPGLLGAFGRTGEDLGALRLFDPHHPDEPLVVAGAPWFMTLFGRDSILTSLMALLLDPTLALGTARALARLQGTRVDPATEQEPGRILHEVRYSSGASLALADGDVYYGSVDATPLFVVLVAELHRWGCTIDDLRPLLPAVDAALAWMQGHGDRDGDGWLEYAPSFPGSLANQGWKDSGDGISFADGRMPAGPIALCEVQGYAYAAWRGGAALARAAGDAATGAARDARADDLAGRFDQDFWMPEAGAYALALDGDKRQVDAIASNQGHCLWSGIVQDHEKAAAVARWLVSPELATGWGIRTLATSMTLYNPLSYHNGSVWPHDTAVCVAGLRRAGFVDEALQIASDVLAASAAASGRLPELFAGLTTAEFPGPVPYPASCSPQAWASAAPLLLLRAFLGWEPDLPSGTLALKPVLPAGARRLTLSGVPLGGARVTIDVDGDAVGVSGLPPGVALVRPA